MQSNKILAQTSVRVVQSRISDQPFVHPPRTLLGLYVAQMHPQRLQPPHRPLPRLPLSVLHLLHHLSQYRAYAIHIIDVASSPKIPRDLPHHLLASVLADVGRLGASGGVEYGREGGLGGGCVDAFVERWVVGARDDEVLLGLGGGVCFGEREVELGLFRGKGGMGG